MRKVISNLKRKSFENFKFLNVVVSISKVLVQHPSDHVGNVRLQRMPNARENIVLVHYLKRHAAALKDVQDLKWENKLS